MTNYGKAECDLQFQDCNTKFRHEGLVILYFYDLLDLQIFNFIFSLRAQSSELHTVKGQTTSEEK